MAKEHPLETIAATGAEQVARAEMGANKTGYEARGKALATTIVNECMSQAGNWTRFYRDLLTLESWGRAAFRKELNAAVKNHADKGAVTVAAQRSAKVRISEFNTIARAIDAGVVFDPTWAFHYAVGMARTVSKSAAGRKATPALDKIKAYLQKNVPNGEMGKVLEIVKELAEAEGKQEEAML